MTCPVCSNAVTPQQAKVFVLLYTNPGVPMSFERIREAMGTKSKSKQYVRHQVNWLKRNWSEAGLHIRNNYGEGYVWKS